MKMGEDFGKVARKVSIGPEAAKGGDLDFFARGVMPEAIDRVVFTLPVGKVSGIVQSPYGYHIFKLLGRKEAGGRIFSEVKERVIADLRKLKEAEAYERWIEGRHPDQQAPSGMDTAGGHGDEGCTSAGRSGETLRAFSVGTDLKSVPMISTLRRA